MYEVMYRTRLVLCQGVIEKGYIFRQHQLELQPATLLCCPAADFQMKSELRGIVPYRRSLIDRTVGSERKT